MPDAVVYHLVLKHRTSRRMALKRMPISVQRIEKTQILLAFRSKVSVAGVVAVDLFESKDQGPDLVIFLVEGMKQSATIPTDYQGEGC